MKGNIQPFDLKLNHNRKLNQTKSQAKANQSRIVYSKYERYFIEA